MYEAHRESVEFLLVYIREAPAIDSRSPMTFGLIEDPINDLERQSVAKTCMAKLALEPIPAVLDRIDDEVNTAYKGWPDRLYLVGLDGKIAYGGGRGPFGFKPEELEEAIVAELKRIKQQ